MVTREMIIEELAAKGYEAKATEVIKNGVEFKGIIMGNGTICPTIYTDQFNDYEDMEDVIDVIMYQYNKAQEQLPAFNVENIMNWDYAKTKLQLCIQTKGSEDIVKRNFLDLEQYVRVYVSNDGSFKVKPEHLEKFGVSEDILFHAAWDCTKPTITETNMAEIMAEMMGEDVKEFEEEMIANGTMQIVISNKSKVYGAIAIYNTEMLSEIANRYDADLAILPSSIHECIIVPLNQGVKLSNLTQMVQEVNETQVAPEEVLSNHAYVYSRDTNKITY